jgi:hypothetical protein
MTEDPVISDPPRGRRDGPTKNIDPADSHSGEGLESVRPGLARSLAESARRSANKQPDAMSSRRPLEPSPEQQVPAIPPA